MGNLSLFHLIILISVYTIKSQLALTTEEEAIEKSCNAIKPTSYHDCQNLSTESTYCCYVTGQSYVNKTKKDSQRCYFIRKVNVTDLLPEVIEVTKLVTGKEPDVNCNCRYLSFSLYFSIAILIIMSIT